MKKLMITAAALMIACAAYGQGAFFFNTHDVANGNNVQFTFNNALADATTANLNVQVFAGPDAAHLTAIAGAVLPLNRTGAGAGYTNPFSGNYVVPGMAGGSTAFVGYEAFQGTSLASATATSALTLATSSVVLQEPPNVPNEVALGVRTGATAVNIVPEPATLALGAIGLGTVLLFRRRK